jgi:hypothetical protein
MLNNNPQDKRVYYTYVLTDPRTNLPFYIGKGKARRMYQHKNNALSETYKHKYELHDFINEIICEGYDIVYVKVLSNVSEQEAIDEERKLIDRYGRINNGTGILYNRVAGGSGCFHLTVEQIQHRREKSSKAVSQYDLDGNFIETFPSAKRASEKIDGANRSYITQCCKGKRKSAGGFMWTYEGAEPPEKYRKQYNKYVYQYTKDGVFIKRWESLTEAATYYDRDVRSLSKACSGGSKSCAGFRWSLSNNQETTSS